jgi:hypothetical protein
LDLASSTREPDHRLPGSTHVPSYGPGVQANRFKDWLLRHRIEEARGPEAKERQVYLRSGSRAGELQIGKKLSC